LVGVKRNDVDAGIGLAAVEQVRFEEVLEQHVGMRAVGEDGEDRRNPGPAFGKGAMQAGRQRQRGGTQLQQRATCQHLRGVWKDHRAGGLP